MEQTIKIADKQTLDEVKSLLEEQSNKSIPYIICEGTISSYMPDYTEVLSVEGKGKLYLAANRGAIHTSGTKYPCGIRITKNPNVASKKEVILDRKSYSTSASSTYESIGIYSKDFFPLSKGNLESNNFMTFVCGSATAGTIFYPINKEDAIISDAQSVSGGATRGLLYNNPIEFSSGIKVEVYGRGNYGIIYTLDILEE